MTPSEQYETERYARLAKALEEDAKQPANFCSSHDADEVDDARLDLVIACVFAIVATPLVVALADWILPIIWRMK